MKVLNGLAAALVVGALIGVPASAVLAAGGSTSSPSGGGSGALGSTSVAGSQPVPGKRKAVEDGLRQRGAAPTPAQDKQELQTLNQISRQVAPSVTVPAPEVSH